MEDELESKAFGHPEGASLIGGRDLYRYILVELSSQDGMVLEGDIALLPSDLSWEKLGGRK